MKGVSLAIETIIFIILAVTVLTVLVLFFLGTGAPAQSKIELEGKRNLLCGEYITFDSECKTLVGFTKSDELINICKKLDASDACRSGGIECVKSCCMLCPKPQKSSEGSGGS